MLYVYKDRALFKPKTPLRFIGVSRSSGPRGRKKSLEIVPNPNVYHIGSKYTFTGHRHLVFFVVVNILDPS